MMDKPRIVVLYGSQTGNAQDVAERIAREGGCRHYAMRALPMDTVPIGDLQSTKYAIFVCSTTGQGETPDGMKSAWKAMLRKSLQPNTLENMAYAVFGLGDSGYVQYNVTAKKLDRRLEQLGGHRLVPKGLGDDQHPNGYEATLDDWLPKLWQKLRQEEPLPAGLTDPQPDAPQPLEPPRFSVTVLSKDEASHHVEASSSKFKCLGSSARLAAAAAASAAFKTVSTYASGIPTQLLKAGSPNVPNSEAPHMAPVTVNRRLTSHNHFQAVQHLEMDISGTGLAYQPGDLLAVFPRVEDAYIDAFLQRFDLSPDDWIRISCRHPPSDGTATVDPPTAVMSAHSLASGVLDISGAAPRRRVFEILADTAADETERDRLEYFAAVEGRNDLYVYNQREGRNLLEVLQDFGSARPDIGHLLEGCPLLRARQFSLSSSMRAHEGRVHITVAAVDWKTPFGRARHGLCSTWLASLQLGELVPLWIDQGSMTMPTDLKKPLILVGPGTGLAPFRSFLHDRAASKRAGDESVAPCVLILGCRFAEKDYLYRQEWDQLVKEGVIQESGLLCAFSRDQASKVYVQDKVNEHASQLWELLHSHDAVVYVSGSADKMPASVAKAFASVIATGLGCSVAEGEKFQRQLEAAKRYFVEAW